MKWGNVNENHYTARRVSNVFGKLPGSREIYSLVVFASFTFLTGADVKWIG